MDGRLAWSEGGLMQQTRRARDYGTGRWFSPIC